MNPDPIFLPSSLRFLRNSPLPRKLGLLEKLYGKTLAAHGKATVECANGYTWTLDLDEVTHRWLVYGDCEGQQQKNWLSNWLSHKGGGVFIDSGANIGQYVVSLSHLPGVQTFAFEPVSNEMQWLQSCLHRYPEWAVEIVPLALGADKQQLKIRLAGGKSTLRQDWYINQQLDEELIDMTTLDNFAKEKKIERIRLWKLDMEGYEPQALAGAQALLAEQRIDALLIEAQTSTIPAIKQNLAIGNYNLFQIQSSSKLVPASDWIEANAFEGNLIALPGKAGDS
ncbi:FkbM family methyltransferase [Cyanobium sp. BA5m-21]|uniref:FkbM family methyltransferase n=1 Tax=unclassified Cyanobium TaxID=2627006 RepID=UPI0020CFD753|nr:MULTISPECIES: FkbM family methyltransferase [unclassified Cyanobium]MCP9903251.1 FkbM family methyltransferase [Cyanobium sp. BA5m-10]MCP9907939.1 FkbM family methyltransferase [Cyanobium sp. BA5m-21]